MRPTLIGYQKQTDITIKENYRLISFMKTEVNIFKMS